jgi:hypothetical protein
MLHKIVILFAEINLGGTSGDKQLLHVVFQGNTKKNQHKT